MVGNCLLVTVDVFHNWQMMVFNIKNPRGEEEERKGKKRKKGRQWSELSKDNKKRENRETKEAIWRPFISQQQKHCAPFTTLAPANYTLLNTLD